MSKAKLFLIIPSNAEPGLKLAVGSYLKMFSFMETTDAEPNLLVVIPRYYESQSDCFSIHDLHRLRRQYKQPPRVLLLNVHGLGPWEDLTFHLPWLHVISKIDFSTETIRTWLSANHSGKVSQQAPPQVTELKQLIDAKFDEIVDQLFKYDSGGIETTPALLKSAMFADFLWGLVRLEGKYSRVEHDLNREGATHGMGADLHATSILLRQAEAGSGTSVAVHKKELKLVLTKHNALLRKRFHDACHDILQSLRFAVPPPAGGLHRIVLVDDQPDLIFTELQEVLTVFLPKYQLWSLKINPEDDVPFKILHDYSSWQSLGTTCNVQVVESADPNVNATPIDIFKLIKETAFFLVDFLHKMPDGSERNLGPRLIGGLARLIRDTPKESSHPRPAIIALSRADEIEKVQLSLQAGADGYVQKSRLLAMPAIMGRIAGVGGINRCERHHRNFNALSRLQGEIARLIKMIKIPATRFDEKPGRESPAPTSKERAVAELLLAMPKTDLHVHAGSCMTPMFLVAASEVMLAWRSEEEREKIVEAWVALKSFWKGKKALWNGPRFKMAEGDGDPVKVVAEKIIKIIGKIRKANTNANGGSYRVLRSAIHKHLGIRDHLCHEEMIEHLEKKAHVEIVFFALAFWGLRSKKVPKPITIEIKKDDIRRLFVLFLASQADSEFDCTWRFDRSTMAARLDVNDRGGSLRKLMRKLIRSLMPSDHSGNSDPMGDLRSKGWAGDPKWPRIIIHPQRVTGKTVLDRKIPAGLPKQLATGPDAEDLCEYLAGCEYQGAEFLQHPYLMHLYAQQTAEYFARHGILYAEIRAAVNGFATNEFTFNDACSCLQRAFSDARKCLCAEFKSNEDDRPPWYIQNGPSKPEADSYRSIFEKKLAVYRRRHPALINILLTGKRHKANREMIKEAAALIALGAPCGKGVSGSKAPVSYEDDSFNCRLAGFDLAGLEDGFPPALFKQNFEQLSRMHIPVTVHAGENASAEFVEGAVLDLRAQRIGHGLALVEDRSLMNRVRENRVCLELCPVSNYQTNKFSDGGRIYPLREYLENGNPFCINTDNPSVSATNIVKEYFQASYAYTHAGEKGSEGFSLWDALHIMRMGFVHAFMSLPERRSLLELADQILFDLFTDDEIVELLRSLALQTDEYVH